MNRHLAAFFSFIFMVFASCKKSPGEIKVKSAENKETEFVLELPTDWKN